KAAEVYVIGRMGITLRGQAGDQGPRSPPASVAFNASCEDDLSRVDSFDPTSPAQMGEEKVSGGLDRCHFDLVFNRELEDVAVPIEIFPPYLRGKRLNALPSPATESRLVPGTGREAWDTEVDARHLLGSP